MTNVIHQKVDMLYHNADLLDPKNLPVVRHSMQTGRFLLQDQKFIQSYVDLRPNYLLLEDDLFQMTQHENLTFIDTDKTLLETYELPSLK